MRFAKAVFMIASVWGFITLIPSYFLFDVIGRQDPPPITHPQFYFGFLGVALAWQVVFFMIARDPMRFRPMMIPSVIEKLAYIAAVAVLYSEQRISPSGAVSAIPDTVLMALFVIAFVKTESTPSGR